MNQIADKTTTWLLKEEIILDTDLEVYKYGIRHGLDNILHILILITEAAIIGVISVLFGKVLLF